MEAIREAIKLLVEGKDIGGELAGAAVGEIMGGRCTPAQIGGFLVGMRAKGESPEEIAAMAQAMRACAVRISPAVDRPPVDLCGTGGAPVKTYNVSTVASFVVAGAGIPVAKHGNRSHTSKCGSADLMEALGVNLEAPPRLVEEAIVTVGIGFLFAPVFHPAMRHAAGPRRELGIRTVFNLLGPLTNPAGVRHQLLGAGIPDLVEIYPEVLRLLGAERALVVHGVGGVDEVSLLGETLVGELRDGEITHYRIRPGAFGLGRASPEEVGPLDPPAAAATARAILRGEEKGARHEMILLNAAAAIYVAGRAPSIEEGLALAEDSIRSGAAYAALEGLVAFTNRPWTT
jgi:anthranilate phosphoribosyltransferase